MLENERHKLNVERRKKKATHYQAYEEEEIDEFGQIKRKEILDKYDEGLDGEAKKKEKFRLDETGHYDLDKEAKEAEAKRRLMMVNKKFESLGETKYTLAKEFYTEEEVIQFRRTKKKKTKNTRKKASTLELQPLEETQEEKKIREEKLAARKSQQTNGGFMEEGELFDENKKETKQLKDSIAMPPPDQTKWKKPKTNVNREEEDEDEEEFPHVSNVVSIQIDDDAEEELNSILAKARLLKNSEKIIKKEINYFASDSSEEDNEEENKINSNSIIFDATSEKYKSIGGGSYGGVELVKKLSKLKMMNQTEKW
ncbi:hypothetical protein Mgra_00009722 [Meloidogyne graminicola]|uniref:Uncharacterized protein n=1 Tax=Meloidogyne graminicola TaxID=189291 RepID=A0A8S9ZAV9_9BILA|nr:hypothetical protein Mgra_00009722 [Meloidogyne graminicola]